MTEMLGADGKPLYRLKNRPGADPVAKPQETEPNPGMSKLEILDREAWLANPITKEYHGAIMATVEETKAEVAEKAINPGFIASDGFLRFLADKAARIEALTAVVSGAKDILLSQKREQHGRQPE